MTLRGCDGFHSTDQLTYFDRRTKAQNNKIKGVTANIGQLMTSSDVNDEWRKGKILENWEKEEEPLLQWRQTCQLTRNECQPARFLFLTHQTRYNLAALSHPRSKQVVNERKLCRRVDCRYFCYMITDGNCWRWRVVSWYVHKHPVKSSSDVGILIVYLEVVNNNWHRCGILWGATFILSCICIITSRADVVFTS